MSCSRIFLANLRLFTIFSMFILLFHTYILDGKEIQCATNSPGAKCVKRKLVCFKLCMWSCCLATNQHYCWATRRVWLHPCSSCTPFNSTYSTCLPALLSVTDSMGVNGIPVHKLLEQYTFLCPTFAVMSLICSSG